MKFTEIGNVTMVLGNILYNLFMGLLYLIAFAFSIKCFNCILQVLYKIYTTCYHQYAIEYNINRIVPINDTVKIKIKKHEIPTYIVVENPSNPKYTIGMIL